MEFTNCAILLQSGSDKMLRFRGILISSDVQVTTVRTPPPPPAAVARSRTKSSKPCVSCGTACWRYVSFVYVAFRLLYSIAFTLTALQVVVAYLVADDVARLGTLPDVERRERNASAASAVAVERGWRDERQRLRVLADGQRTACANYVSELFDSVAAKIDGALAERGASASGENRHMRRRQNESISGAFEDRMRRHIVRYAAELERARTSYRDRTAASVSSAIAGYRKYLGSVFTNDWLSLAQRIFNESLTAMAVAPPGMPIAVPRLIYGPIDERLQAEAVAWKSAGLWGVNLTGVEARFGNFIELQEVEEIQMWSAQFWER